MSEPNVEVNLVSRIEELARENERLTATVAHLNMGVGHAMVLVQLAAAVRAWRDDPTEEARAEMFSCVEQYDRARGGVPPRD